MYTIGDEYAHAEARKSPVLDGKVDRDSSGKELRYPVILNSKEKLIAHKVTQAFKVIVFAAVLLFSPVLQELPYYFKECFIYKKLDEVKEAIRNEKVKGYKQLLLLQNISVLIHGFLAAIKDIINCYNCLLKNSNFSIKTSNE